MQIQKVSIGLFVLVLGMSNAQAQQVTADDVGDPRATVCRLTETECDFIVRNKARARLAAAAQTELSAREHFLQWEDKWIYTIPRHIAFEWQRIRHCELGLKRADC